MTDREWFWNAVFLLFVALAIGGAVLLFVLQRKCTASGGTLTQKWRGGPIECVR